MRRRDDFGAPLWARSEPLLPVEPAMPVGGRWVRCSPLWPALGGSEANGGFQFSAVGHSCTKPCVGEDVDGVWQLMLVGLDQQMAAAWR